MRKEAKFKIGTWDVETCFIIDKQFGAGFRFYGDPRYNYTLELYFMCFELQMEMYP